MTETSTRSRRRRNVIGNSPNRDEYTELMRHWSDQAIEQYAWHRYGEDIPRATIGAYRRKHGIERANTGYNPADKYASADGIPDVLGGINDLLNLQRDRIRIDHKHEISRDALNPKLRNEIALMNQLLGTAKATMQDLGLLPKSSEKLEIKSGPMTPVPEAGTPRLKSLEDITGDADAARLLARQLDSSIPNVIPIRTEAG